MKAPVITGAGAVTPLGRDLETTAARLAAGDVAIEPLHEAEGPPRRDVSPAARIGAFTTDPEMPRAKARRLDRGSQYAIVAARQCLGSSRYEMTGREERTGILLGSGSAGAGPLVELERQMAVESPETVSPFLFPYTVANAPASLVAIELQIRGPNVTITQKDPAALNCLHYGRMLLADRSADALLVGGADEWNLEYHLGFERVHATRTAGRPGHALSEGAAFVMVEDEEAARARGAHPWARVAGVCSAGAPVSPHARRADPSFVARVVGAALADAGVPPGDVGLVHRAANGFPCMERAEEEGLRAVLGGTPALPFAPAVKLQIGENPVVGALQLALAARAFRDDPALGAALVVGLGAGGNAVVVVLTAVR